MLFVLFDEKLLRLAMIPGLFMMFGGMIFTIRDEVKALRLNETYKPLIQENFMYYFIPAWYGSERTWHATITPWYFSHFRLEFDDTFIRFGSFKSKIQILVYQYQLTSLICVIFYIGMGVFGNRKQYSIFDVMQDFHNLHTQVLTIRDIEWDNDM